MSIKKLLPAHLFDNESIIFIDDDSDQKLYRDILDSKPDTILVVFFNHKELSILQQQETVNKLKSALANIGKSCAVLYCDTPCFNQYTLSAIPTINTVVLLGLKPFNMEVPLSRFYKRIPCGTFELIVCHSVYTMDREQLRPSEPSMKLKLWNILNSKQAV